MNYMTRTAPFRRGFMCDFFRHLENEMHWRALVKRQIRCKGYASCRNIQRLHCVLWRGRFRYADTKRNFEPESFGKASFGASHGNDIPPWLIRGLSNQIDITDWQTRLDRYVCATFAAWHGGI
jgi:hypothetical protein